MESSDLPQEATRTGAAEPSQQVEGPVFDPVARAMDLIGERWLLVLVRQLLGGPRGFQMLRERTGIAPRVLSSRLRQLTERGFIESVQVGTRQQYALTESGRDLAPIVRSIARWWVLNHQENSGPFRESSVASVIESLPFMLNEERARGVHQSYEVRLTGKGGGVWTVTVDDGDCQVSEGFAERADVRYTADAQEWCLLAIGVTDDREAVRAGRLIKDGLGGSMAWYFYQPGKHGRGKKK
jgi:DNA-binding HxlR family transcriptional regulator